MTVRPLSVAEKDRGETAVFVTNDNSIYSGADRFHYDHVIPENATNEQVYASVARDVVRTVATGRSGAVMMYGATGSGKTWTMTGGAGDPGIVQRAITDLFTDLPADQPAAVRLSILEVYNEELNDLLSLNGARLELRQAMCSSGCHVAGLTQVPLTSAPEAMSALARRIANRRVRNTAMNDASSRSHTIITFTLGRNAPRDVVTSQDPEEVVDDVATLHLVDLAGSESGRVISCKDGRRESASINRSLLALGTVVSALSEGVASHVNFRDSKLTRLLQATLTGSGSRVAIICTATPAASQAHETRNTLEFGRRAKKVQIPKQAPQPPTGRELLCGPVLADEHVSRQPQVAADAEMRVCRETRVDQGVGLLINQLRGLGLESMPDVDLLSLIDTLRETMEKVRIAVEGRHKNLIGRRGHYTGKVTPDE
ncbi:hypothetical protein WJX75_007339 [Coccomyxa subellipsoidea]|uniref:Kinesin-like protein n=1 Tax=Coccomyxa subellipsoidea TaxID=248742 RepID=A0ABR2YBP0_9CHLO